MQCFPHRVWRPPQHHYLSRMPCIGCRYCRYHRTQSRPRGMWNHRAPPSRQRPTTSPQAISLAAAPRDVGSLLPGRRSIIVLVSRAVFKDHSGPLTHSALDPSWKSGPPGTRRRVCIRWCSRCERALCQPRVPGSKNADLISPPWPTVVIHGEQHDEIRDAELDHVHERPDYMALNQSHSIDARMPKRCALQQGCGGAGGCLSGMLCLRQSRRGQSRGVAMPGCD